jgi:hypothetical protein
VSPAASASARVNGCEVLSDMPLSLVEFDRVAATIHRQISEICPATADADRRTPHPLVVNLSGTLQVVWRMSLLWRGASVWGRPSRVKGRCAVAVPRPAAALDAGASATPFGAGEGKLGLPTSRRRAAVD